jgi:DNA-binding MarR family transcriptional regulator
LNYRYIDLIVVRDIVLVVEHPSGADHEAALAAAAAVRRGVMSLGRRLKLERPAGSLTSLELSVLGHLHRHGELTPGDIAAAERVQPQTLTRTLASLEHERLISRLEHPQDGRRTLLALTGTGLEALRADMDQRDAWLAAAMDGSLSGTERELLRLASELLERLALHP